MFLWILLLIVVFLWKGLAKEGMTHTEIKTKMEFNYDKITRYLNAVDVLVSKFNT